MKNIKKILVNMSVLIMIIGCGASYEKVNPNISEPTAKVEHKKVVELVYDSSINDINRTMGGIVVDMKIIPFGNDFVSAKLYVDKYIKFDYIAPIRTSSLNGVTITEEKGVPPNFVLTQKVKLPSYKVGINAFDLNSKGHFAYISDKKVIKIVKKIPTNTLKYLAKNKNYSKGSNVLTIRTGKEIKQISFQPNSKNLVVLLENNSIELWNYIKKKKIKTIRKSKSNISMITVSPKGKYLLVSNVKDSQLIDLKSNKLALTIPEVVTASNFTKEEDSLVVTGVLSKVMHYDLDTKTLVQSFSHSHKGLVYGLVFNPHDSKTIFTAGQDGVIKAWDLLNANRPISKKYNTYNQKSNCNANWLKKQYFSNSSKSLSTFQKLHKTQITECNVLGDKSQVMALANKDNLHPYMTALIETLVNKYQPVKQEWINVDVYSNVTGSARKEIYDWKRSQGMQTVRENEGTINEKLVNKYVYSETDLENYLKTDKKILKYKKQAVAKKIEEYTHLLPQMNAGAIYGLVAYGNKIYSYGTGFQNNYSYYKTNTPNVRAGYGMYQYKFNFKNINEQKNYKVIEKETFNDAGRTRYVIKTKDEHTVITVKDNQVRFFDYKLNKLVDIVSENAEVKSVAYDKHNNILAVGLTNNIIKLWDMKIKKPIGKLMGHKGEVVSLSFANKGNLLFSGSYDETAIIWDVKTKKMLKTLTGFERAAYRIQVIPKQNIVAVISAGNSDSDVFFYDLNTYNLVKKISPKSGILQGVTLDKNYNRLILASSGETLNQSRGHILFTVNLDSFKTTKKYYSAPYRYIRGLVSNEQTNTLYAIGNSSTFKIFDLDSLREVEEYSNMKNDDYNWGKIYSVGVTENNMPIVADGNRVISIFK